MSTVTEEAPKVNAENATSVATDFLKRLGYKRGLLPKKVSLEEQVYVVEIDLEKKAAKVQIDSRTKEIREYEIAESENSGGMSSKIKLIMLVIPIVAVVVGLKLGGVF
jgi:hypothetical protein